MRFDPRAPKFEILIAASLMASLLGYSSNAVAQDTLRPLIKGAPKFDMNWSDTRKPRQMKLSQLRSKLRPADEMATLYALQVALSRVGDGQTYIWGRPKRKLRALITPVKSYRSAKGNICRKIVVSLVLGPYLKRIKTSACRASDKSWKLQS